MTKIISSGSIQSALQTLLFTDETLKKTQERVTTGMKVGEAADNAGYWSTASNLRSDGVVFSNVGDALNLGASKVDTAYEAVTSMVDIVDQIMGQLTTAHETGTDRNTINQAISGLRSNLFSVAQAASFSGDNWLFNSAAQVADTKSIPYFFEKSSTGAVSLKHLSINTSDLTMVDTSDPERGLLTKGLDAGALKGEASDPSRIYSLIGNSGTPISVSDSTTPDELDDMVTVVGEVAKQLNQLASSLGTMSGRIEQQSTFVSALGDSLDKSVSRLVDANMEEESVKLAAFKTERDLAVQVVSMANDHRRSLARLFG
ncbi:flagellin [Agrobacterium larrymoorei]|uniref:flagellin N-terminal helical domain-containing protein n=1 Tax=Agrobacterium larrymoorei TaxID=160699 RepID=UPI001571FFD2|nr:flagellin [Agrobacterium larrymoorei]NTJ41350.1 flagellin [Agrobacterium larrymoorei]